MKYNPGELVEITATIDVDPTGRAVQTLSPEYIGKLGLVIYYDRSSFVYYVLVGNEEETIEVYEQEMRLVNG